MNETSSSYHKYVEKIEGKLYSGLYEVSHPSNKRGLDPQFTVLDKEEPLAYTIETILLNRHLDVVYAPKPDIVHETSIILSPFAGPMLYAASPTEANIVLVFDGETGKLKQCTIKEA